MYQDKRDPRIHYMMEQPSPLYAALGHALTLGGNPYFSMIDGIIRTYNRFSHMPYPQTEQKRISTLLNRLEDASARDFIAEIDYATDISIRVEQYCVTVPGIDEAIPTEVSRNFLAFIANNQFADELALELQDPFKQSLIFTTCLYSTQNALQFRFPSASANNIVDWAPNVLKNLECFGPEMLDYLEKNPSLPESYANKVAGLGNSNTPRYQTALKEARKTAEMLLKTNPAPGA